MFQNSRLLAHLVSGLSFIQEKRSLRITKVLIILTIVFMVMSGGEPAYAEWCSRC